MPSQARTILLFLAVLAVAGALWASPEVKSSPTTTVGKPDFESAGQLAFGPDDVLFVADSRGATVYALDLADGGEPGAEPPEVDEVDAKVAALLGTEARDVLIDDIAVHPRSKNVYLSVSRGRGDDAQPVLVKVAGGGELSLVDLEKVRYTEAPIVNAPDPDAKTRRGQPKRTMTITDLAYSDGYVYVAGLSNEEFESNLRKIPYPFTGEMSGTSVEIYHGAHGEFETHSPIRTFMPYEIKGEPHLLAAYTCTPLVTFPLKGLEDGAHVKGTTIAELGFGNRPLDMIRFDKEGEPYVLVLNSSRGGMRIRPQDIEKAGQVTPETKITREEPMAGVPYTTVPMGGVLRADNYDDENLVVLRRDLETGSLSLRLWSTRWL